MQPATDLVFSETLNAAVLLIDQFDHMQVELVPEAGTLAPTREEDDSSADEEVKEETKKKEAPKAAEKPKEETPVIYNCQACTLENPVSVTECAICGTARPPMEVIIAEFRAA